MAKMGDGGGMTVSPPSEADRFLSTVGGVAGTSAVLKRNSEASTGKAGCPPVDPSSTRECAEPVGTVALLLNWAAMMRVVEMVAVVIVAEAVVVTTTGTGITGKTGAASPRSLKSGLSSDVCRFLRAAVMMDKTISLA
jgi:hypothetical protein